MEMQVTRHNRDNYDLEAEQARVTRLVEQERRANPAMYTLPSAVATAVANAPPLPPPVPFKPFGAATTVPPRIPAVPSTGLPSAPPRPATGGYLPPRPATTFQPNVLAHITTSTVVVSARMLKLKAELLNLLYLMPERVLRLPELDEAGEKAIADAGAEAAATIRTGLAKLSSANSAAAASASTPAAAPAPSAGDSADADTAAAPAAPPAAPSAAGPASTHPQIDLSMSNVERLVDKAARKAKRRLRRKLSMEKFLKDTQEATMPQQLLVLVTSLENALPPMLLYKNFHRAQVPVTADTLAAVAVRLFALDRAIAYDEIKNVENNAVQCPFRLRSQFYPRCILMSSCNRFIGHTGKCSNMMDGSGSRIPEFQDIVNLTRMGVNQFQYQAPIANRPGYAMSVAQAQAQANQRKLAYMQQMAALKPKDEDLALEEVLKKLLQVRKELDIETIQPYFPVKDITAMDWI
jgi:hypothetical protein